MYFFKPFIGTTYLHGIGGAKILITTASQCCLYSKCTFYSRCTVETHLFDKCCPRNGGPPLSDCTQNEWENYIEWYYYKSYENSCQYITEIKGKLN